MQDPVGSGGFDHMEAHALACLSHVEIVVGSLPFDAAVDAVDDGLEIGWRAAGACGVEARRLQRMAWRLKQGRSRGARRATAIL